MKLLLFSDLHGDLEAAHSLIARTSEFDALIGAGDFCNARRGLEQAIAPFFSISIPTIFVAGNNESPDELRLACKGAAHILVLHGQAARINGQMFFGIGGSIPVTPFGSQSFDLDEKEATQLMSPCPANAILISHSPPLGTLDVSSSGKHLGSRAVAECMNAKKPKLLVCGHIHASGGQSQLVSETLVVNAGPQGMVWES